jgi:hypothetical protein
MSSTTKLEEKFAPARRVAGQKQDVWYVKTLAHMSVEVVLTLATKGQSLTRLPLLRQYSQSVCSEEHSVKDTMANR